MAKKKEQPQEEKPLLFIIEKTRLLASRTGFLKSKDNKVVADHPHQLKKEETIDDFEAITKEEYEALTKESHHKRDKKEEEK